MPSQTTYSDSQVLTPHPDGNKPEFNQATAAAYACNGSGQITARSIRRATDNGELHPVKIGHKWLYSRADIDAWLASKSAR